MISLRSELRRKLLTFFYVNPSARVYVRELAAALGADSTNVSRELASLRREGFLRSEAEGRQLYSSVNPAYPYLKPVFALLRGTVGIVPALKHALASIPGIESAWLYGSFAKNEADAASDIDVLIVGQPDQGQLASAFDYPPAKAHLEALAHELVRGLAAQRREHPRLPTLRVLG